MIAKQATSLIRCRVHNYLNKNIQMKAIRCDETRKMILKQTLRKKWFNYVVHIKQADAKVLKIRTLETLL